jgi:hypothetical protein
MQETRAVANVLGFIYHSGNQVASGPEASLEASSNHVYNLKLPAVVCFSRKKQV